MPEVILRADTGRITGTRPSRRLRRRGMVPATLYGKESEPLSISVGARELRSALTTDAGVNAVINLHVGQKTHTSLARQIQRHPIRGDILHLDFVKISLTDLVEAVVSIDLVGETMAIRESGGIIETVANTVTVRALVTAIPESIEIEITDLLPGDTLRVSDLPTISGVEYLDHPEQPLVTISLSRIAIAEDEDESEEELQDGEQPVDAMGGTAGEA